MKEFGRRRRELGREFAANKNKHTHTHQNTHKVKKGLAMDEKWKRFLNLLVVKIIIESK